MSGRGALTRGGGALLVDRAGGSRGRPGDLVVVTQQGRGHAQVDRVIGRPDVARAVIEGLMIDRGLERGFSSEVESQAQEARDRALRAPRAGERRDLRELATFTIDPIAAQDFDDALSGERLDHGLLRVWVHIADVSAFVAPRSALDREARRRANSVYVPGAVEPMLPQALSNDACSLVPGQDRLAVTVELDLQGVEVRRAAFYRSVIRSDARLEYDQVDRIFAGAESGAEPWAAPLEVAREAAATLSRERVAGGALTLDAPEPEFVLDDEGHVSHIAAREQTEAHRLIEQLMVLANEQVARVLAERRAPTLYRVHERPDPQRVERLAVQLASLDVPTPPLPEPMSPAQAALAVAEMSRLVDGYVRRRGGRGRMALTSLVLRSLTQAYYSPRNAGHAGLGLAHYCHFTSPIRRYPDLVCHRALLAAVCGQGSAPQASELPELGEWTSAQERVAMVIERDADDIAHCFALERELFELGWNQIYEGEVAGLIESGAFLALPSAAGLAAGLAYEGMLPVRRMRGDWWELNEEGTILHGTRTDATVRLGDVLEVRVERIETARGRVDLDLAQQPTRRSAPARTARGSPTARRRRG